MELQYKPPKTQWLPNVPLYFTNKTLHSAHRMYFYVRRTNKMKNFFIQWFNSTILSSKGFDKPSVHHQEDCTSSFMVFYHAFI